MSVRVLLALFLPIAASAACRAAPPLTSGAPGAAGGPARSLEPMVVVPIEEARFFPVSARLPDGPRMAVLWGDPSSGPSAVLLEMKRGAVPLHTHTSDYHLVVLEGTMRHWSSAQSEQETMQLGPGSYWFQPGGQVHADACLTERCLMQVVWSGPRDAKLATPAGDQRSRISNTQRTLAGSRTEIGKVCRSDLFVQW